MRALTTARLATNRLCARPVQKTPSRASQSQSRAGSAGSSPTANGSRHRATTRFCQSAACTGPTCPLLLRLASDSRANSRPERIAQSRPRVAPLARSKFGVTSTRPRLTRTTSSPSAR
ncbi:Uncharacterised protein [Acinetobacter baumannii]|nr:Uncharacterised protein [Acinetobacter baumannii]